MARFNAEVAEAAQRTQDALHACVCRHMYSTITNVVVITAPIKSSIGIDHGVTTATFPRGL